MSNGPVIDLHPTHLSSILISAWSARAHRKLTHYYCELEDHITLAMMLHLNMTFEIQPPTSGLT